MMVSGTYELWETDGTLAGTKLTKNFGSTVTGLYPIATSSTLYVFVSTSAGNAGLQYTATPNTASSWAIVSGSTVVSHIVTTPTATKDNLYFVGIASGSGSEPYKVTGGTMSLIQDIWPGTNSGMGWSKFVVLDYDTNKVVFPASPGSGSYMYYYSGSALTQKNALTTSSTSASSYFSTSPGLNLLTSTDLFVLANSSTNNNGVIYKIQRSTGNVTIATNLTASGASNVILGQVGNYLILNAYVAATGSELYSFNISTNAFALIPGGDLTSGNSSSNFSSVTNKLSDRVQQLPFSTIGNKVYVSVNSKLYSVSSTLAIEEVVLPTTFPMGYSSFIFSAGPLKDKLILNYNDPVKGEEIYLYKP